jgi:hypothetical protein
MGLGILQLPLAQILMCDRGAPKTSWKYRGSGGSLVMFSAILRLDCSGGGGEANAPT